MIDYWLLFTMNIMVYTLAFHTFLQVQTICRFKTFFILGWSQRFSLCDNLLSRKEWKTRPLREASKSLETSWSKDTVGWRGFKRYCAYWHTKTWSKMKKTQRIFLHILQDEIERTNWLSPSPLCFIFTVGAGTVTIPKKLYGEERRHPIDFCFSTFYLLCLQCVKIP